MLEGFLGARFRGQDIARSSKVSWRCTGKAEKHSSLDSYMKECRKVSAGLGKLTRFYSRGREMSQSDLKNCNRTT